MRKKYEKILSFTLLPQKSDLWALHVNWNGVIASFQSSPLHATSPFVRAMAPSCGQLWKSLSFVSPLLAAVMCRLCLLSWMGGYHGLDLGKKWMEALLWWHINCSSLSKPGWSKEKEADKTEILVLTYLTSKPMFWEDLLSMLKTLETF